MSELAEDELVEILLVVTRARDDEVRPDTLRRMAHVLLVRGYRRSVTPDQIEAAAKAMAEAVGNHSFRTSVQTVQNQQERNLWRDRARAAARAFGLEVTTGE
jgi:hypothetical protein